MVVLFPAVHRSWRRPLRALQLGDDTAKGLGVASSATRRALILVGVALAAVATAAAGPIAFVAFVSARSPAGWSTPHSRWFRRRCRARCCCCSPTSSPAGCFAPTELPVGVITGIIGAPYLVWLLARANKIGRGG